MSQASITRVTADTSTESLTEIIDREGAVIVSGYLDAGEVDRLHDELDPIFEVTPFCQGLFYGDHTKRIHSLVRKSPTCRAMIMRAQVIAVMEAILGPFCDRVQLNLTQGIQIWPGEKAQVLHRDDSMFPIRQKPCEFMVNAMWAYSDFTCENGATIVVPGSHRWDDPARLPVADEITQAEMKPGEVLIYRGSLIHAGGQNRSSAPRTGIALSYCLGWLRQSENQYFAVPPAVARTLPRALQDLLGYCVQRPNLGMVEGNEPRIVFEGSNDDRHVTRDWLTPEQEEQLRQYHAGQALVAA